MTGRVAYFVTPHGFGHATRAAAVMGALQRADAAIDIDIYTRVPRWLFQESLEHPFQLFEEQTDVGIVQETPLVEDLPGTAHALDTFFDQLPATAARLARQLRANDTKLVVCDIAPLGLAVAREAGLPALLVENFTWDFIYEPFVASHPAFLAHVERMAELYDGARWRIQTEPVSRVRPRVACVGPVSRPSRQDRRAVRRAIGVPQDEPLVLLALGGFSGEMPWLDALADHPHTHFLYPGLGERPQRRGHLLLLPKCSGHYHPDLTAACDAVVGKLGYSTVAEVYRAGLPFAFVGRRQFREADSLGAFMMARGSSLEIPVDDFEAGDWLPVVERLLAFPPAPPQLPDGADEIARFILDRR